MPLDNTATLRHPEKAHRPDTPILRKPEWIRVKAPMSTEFAETKALMRKLGLNTVCEEAACPNKKATMATCAIERATATPAI